MVYSNWVLVSSQNKNPGWHTSSMMPWEPKLSLCTQRFCPLLLSTEAEFQAGGREGLAKPTKCACL